MLIFGTNANSVVLINNKLPQRSAIVLWLDKLYYIIDDISRIVRAIIMACLIDRRIRRTADKRSTYETQNIYDRCVTILAARADYATTFRHYIIHIYIIYRRDTKTPRFDTVNFGHFDFAKFFNRHPFDQENCPFKTISLLFKNAR